MYTKIDDRVADLDSVHINHANYSYMGTQTVRITYRPAIQGPVDKRPSIYTHTTCAGRHTKHH